MSEIKEKTVQLIDALKATCQAYGLGNDGNEYKIITQVFLYKFLNDKFGYEVKNAPGVLSEQLRNSEKWELAYADLSEEERFFLQSAISADVPILEPEHLIANLWNQQSKGDFDLIFDSTMTDIADKNIAEQTFTDSLNHMFDSLLELRQEELIARERTHGLSNEERLELWTLN